MHSKKNCSARHSAKQNAAAQTSQLFRTNNIFADNPTFGIKPTFYREAHNVPKSEILKAANKIYSVDKQNETRKLTYVI